MDSAPNWDAYWSGAGFAPLAGTSFFTEFLDVFVPEAVGDRTAVEIGCYPGRFIEYVGRKGYIVSGIDTYPAVVTLNELLRQRGCRIGCFSRMDFRHLHSRFDLVLSIGFLEHFTDWPDMLLRHLACTKPGGRVIIGCPNFATPLQRALHRTVDGANLEGHVLSSMYPPVWGTFLRLLGVVPLYADYLGPFQFWTETPYPPDSTGHHLQQAAIEAAGWLGKIRGEFPAAESGYCLLVADRPVDWSVDPAVASMVGEECMGISSMLDRRDARLAAHLENALRMVVQP